MLIIGLLRISPLDIFRMGGGPRAIAPEALSFCELFVDRNLGLVCLFIPKKSQLCVTSVPDGSL